MSERISTVARRRQAPLRTWIVAALSALVLGGLPAAAQNLVRNAHFDADAAGWSPGNASWDGTRDADGVPRSGSVRSTVVVNQPFDPGDLGCSNAPPTQCIDGIVGGSTYSFGGQVLHPAGQLVRGVGAVYLTWASGSGCAGKFFTVGSPLVESSSHGGKWTSSAAAAVVAPANAHSAELEAFHCVRAMGTEVANFDDLFFTSTTLRLHGGRFEVDVSWSAPGGLSGLGTPIRQGADTGDFWFFGPSNVEMVVKVLDGCGVNGHYWVFAGGLTNVHVAITVTDTQTAQVRTYSNPQGQVFQPIQDTSAFASCP